MGKKPVVAIVGLVWAGMALVGCESCKNCRNRDSGQPPAAHASRGTTPGAAIPPAGGGPEATAVGDARKGEATPKAKDEPGAQGFGKEMTGTPASTPAPTTASSLLQTDNRPAGLPGQSPDYRSGEATPADSSGHYLPPRPPVKPTGAIGTSSLPPLSESTLRALPSSPLIPSAPPAPPLMSGGNTLPPIDPTGK